VSVAAWVWLAVGLATIMVLIAVLIGLIRHLKLLAASLRRFQDEMTPALESIQRDAELAQNRAEQVPARLPSREAGARIRR
jgi:heme exporter protein D